MPDGSKSSSEGSILRRLREACLRIPGVTETATFGHPAFQIEGKTFAVLEEYKGELGIAIKVGKLMLDVFLNDARFFLTPYSGKHGWVTLRVHAAPLNWVEIRGLLKGSIEIVSSNPPPARRGRKVQA